MKTIEDTKIETAYNYAFNYYKQHGRSLDHQNACIDQMVGLTGFDRGTCIDIQNPVQSIMMYNDTVELSHTIIQQQLNTVTGIIRGRLLDINHGKIQEQKVTKIPEYSTGVKGTNFIKALLNKSKITQSEDLTVLSFDGIKDQNPKDGRFKAAVGAVLKIVDDTRYTDNSISNKTKVISMNNCGLEDYDLHCLSPIFEYSLNIDYFSLANNNIKTGSKILREYHHANLYKNGVNCSIKHLNLSNNLIDDTSASIIASHIQKGEVPHLKTLDVSGNLLSKIGEEKLSFAANNTPNESLAIVVEKHSNPSGVSNFFKKAFKYYTEAFAVKTKGNVEVAVAIYGQDDWGYCKKMMVDASRDLSVGFVKYSEYRLFNLMLKKAPDKVKKATVGGVFVVASVDAALNVDVENLAYCIATINKKANSMLDSLTGTHNDTYFSPELIGSNGETEDF